MKFRARLFTVLAALSLLWVVCGAGYACVITGSTVGNATLTPDLVETSVNGQTTTSAAYTVGATLGGTTFAAIFACTGLPLMLIFGLLAWRNNVGLRHEKEHAELIEATRGKTSA